MPHPAAWDPDALQAKARLYFERAFEYDHGDVLFAFWSHMALEQVARAAVAKVSPALLAAPRKQDALLYALGIEAGDPLDLDSLSSASVYALCEKLVPGFGSAERSTCDDARKRRNAELHSATAALESLPRGWIGRFFAACRVLADHLGSDLRGLVGNENAAVIELLIVNDAKAVRAAVEAEINRARGVLEGLSEEARAERRQTANAAGRGTLSPGYPLGRRGPRILRWAECPACAAPAPITGEVVAKGAARLSEDRELVETHIAVPVSLACGVCDLRLGSTAELTSAGLGDAVSLIEYLDPVQVLDIDLGEYRDEFLESLAMDEGPGYMDD